MMPPMENRFSDLARMCALYESMYGDDYEWVDNHGAADRSTKMAICAESLATDPHGMFEHYQDEYEEYRDDPIDVAQIPRLLDLLGTFKEYLKADTRIRNANRRLLR